MPMKPLKPCNQQGCPELIRDGRYCERHKKEKQKVQDERRGSASERGYDSLWQRARLMYLRQHPLCQRCYESGQVMPAVLVHHIQSLSRGGKRLDFSNLMSLCIPCHDAIHREQGDKW